MKPVALSAIIATLVVVGITNSSVANTLTTCYNTDSLKTQLIRDWERAKEYTLEYIEAMPEDGIHYKATPEIRSFAGQMLHLAQGNIGLTANGTGKERIYQGVNLEKSDEYKTKTGLAKIVAESYDFAIAGIKNLDASTLEEVQKRGNFEVTRLGWIMKGFEHQTHHRGQCTIYLRLKGVKPPDEKLF